MQVIVFLANAAEPVQLPSHTSLHCEEAPPSNPKMLEKTMNLRLLAKGTSPSILLFALALPLGAQSTPTRNAGTGGEDEKVIVLSPFEVDAGDDSDSYAARSTLAGSRIRTELKDVGSSISVITQKFLQDTNSTSSESLLVYTPSTEIAGQGGNFLGAGDGTYLNQTINDKPFFTTRVRGTTEADNTRDFYLTDIPWDSYNVGRIDMQRGPNAILFGIGSPAGIINSSINTAALANSYRLGTQVASYGSTRWTLDLNHVLIEDELALRVSTLADHKKYRQDPAFRDDERVFAAARWDPSFLNRGSARTSIRANFEKGTIDSNLPRMTPPNDAITPWFDNLNKRIINPLTYTLEQRTPDPYIKAPANMGANGVVMAFTPSGAADVVYWPSGGGGFSYLPGGPTTYDKTAETLGAAGGFPYVAIGPYKARSLTDPTIFDFYNNLVEGPNKFEFNEFDALNVSLTQTFMNDKIGFELALDQQEAQWGYRAFFNASSATLTVDIHSHLPFGVVNPNVGRPVIIGSGMQSGGSWEKRDRDVARLTAFAELDFNQISGKDSFLAKVFGRNTFSALAVQQKNTGFRANYQGFYPDETFTQAGGGVGSRTLFLYAYMGDSMVANNITSASGQGLQGIKGPIIPENDVVRIYNNTTMAQETVRLGIINNDLGDDRSKSYSGGFKTIEEVDSTAIVWQGYWFGGSVVPMFGIRNDKQESRSAGNPFAVGTIGEVNIWHPNWVVPESPADFPTTGAGASIRNADAKSNTFSLVTHLPDKWRDRLPGRLNVSLIYNKSENVKPEAGRRDVRGNQISDPFGDTEEYGIALTGFNDKVSLKIIKYETNVINATIGSQIGANQYLIGGAEGWGQQRAYAWRDHPGGGVQPGTNTPGPFNPNTTPGATNPPVASAGNLWPAADTVYGYASNGQAVMWMPDGPLKGNVQNGFTYNQTELDSAWAKQNAAIIDWFLPENQVPDDFITMWSLTGYRTEPAQDPGTGIPGFKGLPPGIAVTGDTASSGYEFELIANPVKGLNVMVNAAKTSATRTNLAQSYVDWIEWRWEVFQGPAGDVRMWGGFGGRNQDDRASPTNGGLVRPGPNGTTIGGHGGDGETVRGKYAREIMASYWTFRALEGADVPELRPWTFNVIADYTFQQGALYGFNIGGSYRWQDRSVIGFPVVEDGNGGLRYDVTSPYKGATQGVADMWIGYRKKLTDRLSWRAQINVRNLLANDHLARVTVQPDGSPGGYRIPEPRTWALTNTLEF